jgi:ankyrin repeat protein
MEANRSIQLRGPSDLLDILSSKEEAFLKGFYDGYFDFNYYDGILPHCLVHAIKSRCSLAVIKKLVHLGAEVNHQCIFNGVTPIHYAVSENRSDVVTFLVKEGANLNVLDHIGRKTPLHDAAEIGNAEMVHVLCHLGADPLIADLDGYTPLHIAAFHGHLKAINALVQSGMDINHKNLNTGQTCLHMACEKNDPDFVVSLLFLGAIPSVKDKNGISPMDIINGKENFALIRILERAEDNLKYTLGVNRRRKIKSWDDFEEREVS